MTKISFNTAIEPMGPYYSEADLNDKPISEESIRTLQDRINEAEGSLASEIKEDGFRNQSHVDKSNIKLFTRGSEFEASCFPEINEALISLNLRQTIFDGELRGSQSKYEGFKSVQSRARYKGRIKEEGIQKYLETKPAEHPLQYVVFDILMKDGVSLLNERNDTRRKILEELLQDNKTIIPIERNIVKTPQEIIALYKKKILKEKFEGLVLKQPNGLYIPGDKKNWIKLKKFEPLDLVILGVSRGDNKDFTQALVGTYNDKRQVYQSFGFVNLARENPATGHLFTQDVLELSSKPFSSVPQNVEVGAKTPELYINPEIVLEIRVMNIDIGYGKDYACSVDGKAKYSLRIAYVKSIREDKRADQINTTDFVAKMHKKQK